MSILIFGQGYVGQATASLFKYRDPVVWHDPDKGLRASGIRDISRAIICVPTPSGESGLDITAVLESLEYLESRGFEGSVAIRSTLDFKFLTYVQTRIPLIYWPEFLRQAHAESDFFDPVQVVLGGPDSLVHDWRLWLRSFDYAPNSIWTLTDIASALLIKLGTNTALAAKIIMFNSLYEACQMHGADWAGVRAGVGLDPRIGSGQTMVPGPDGQHGYGGKCLPKDVGALSAMLPDDEFLKALITRNERLRDA